MMILAMLMLWGEMGLIAKLVMEPPSEAPLILDEQAAEEGEEVDGARCGAS